jgi:hypothetical protein
MRCRHYTTDTLIVSQLSGISLHRVYFLSSTCFMQAKAEEALQHLPQYAFIGLFVIWNYLYLFSYGLSLLTFVCVCVLFVSVVHLQRVSPGVVFSLFIIKQPASQCAVDSLHNVLPVLTLYLRWITANRLHSLRCFSLLCNFHIFVEQEVHCTLNCWLF